MTLKSNRCFIFVVTSTSECILCKGKWLEFYYCSSDHVLVVKILWEYNYTVNMSVPHIKNRCSIFVATSTCECAFFTLNDCVLL